MLSIRSIDGKILFLSLRGLARQDPEMLKLLTQLKDRVDGHITPGDDLTEDEAESLNQLMKVLEESVAL